jgi:hypothetical protein
LITMEEELKNNSGVVGGNTTGSRWGSLPISMPSMQRRQQLGSWVGGVKSSVMDRMQSNSTTSVTSTTGSAASATTPVAAPVKLTVPSLEKDIAVAVAVESAANASTTYTSTNPQVVVHNEDDDDDNDEDSPDAEADGRQAASDTDTTSLSRSSVDEDHTTADTDATTEIHTSPILRKTASMSGAGTEERDGASIDNDSVTLTLDREHDGDPTQSSSRPELTEEAAMTKLMLHNNNTTRNISQAGPLPISTLTPEPNLYWRVHPKNIDDCLNCLYDGISDEITPHGQFVRTSTCKRKTATETSLYARARAAAAAAEEDAKEKHKQRDELNVFNAADMATDLLWNTAGAMNQSEGMQSKSSPPQPDMEYDWLLDGDREFVVPTTNNEEYNNNGDCDNDNDTSSGSGSGSGSDPMTGSEQLNVTKAQELHQVMSSLSLEIEMEQEDDHDDDDDDYLPTTMVDCSPHRAFHENKFSSQDGIPSRPTVNLPRTPGLFGSHPALATTLPLPDIHNWRDDHSSHSNNSSSSNSIEYYMSKALARFTRTSQLLMLDKFELEKSHVGDGEEEEKKEEYEHTVLNQLLSSDNHDHVDVDVDVLAYYLSQLPSKRRRKKKKIPKSNRKKQKGSALDQLELDIIGDLGGGSSDESNVSSVVEQSAPTKPSPIDTDPRSLTEQMDDYITDSMAYLDTVHQDVSTKLKKEIRRQRRPLEKQIKLVYFMEDLVDKTLHDNYQDANRDLWSLKQHLHLDEKLDFVHVTKQRARLHCLDNILTHGVEPILEYRQVIQDAIRRLLFSVNDYDYDSSASNTHAALMISPMSADSSAHDTSFTSCDQDDVHGQIVPLAVRFQQAAFHPAIRQLQCLNVVRQEAWTILVDSDDTEATAMSEHLDSSGNDTDDAPIDLCKAMNVSLQKCLKNHIVSVSRRKVQVQPSRLSPIKKKDNTSEEEYEEESDDTETDSESEEAIQNHLVQEATEEAKKDVAQMVIETKLSFSSQQQQEPACRHARTYHALYQLRRQLEHHVSEQAVGQQQEHETTKEVDIDVQLPLLKMKSTWAQAIVCVFQQYLEECVHKVLPLVEFGDHHHMVTAFRYLCRDITNLAQAHDIVQTQWHASLSTNDEKENKNENNNGEDVAASLAAQRSRLWMFCEALLVQLLDGYLTAVNENATSDAASGNAPLGVSSLQGWNHLLELSRWIQRVGLEFVVGVAKKPDSDDSSNHDAPSHEAGMLNDKMNGLLQSCVLQPCRDGAMRDMQALLDNETWGLVPISIDFDSLLVNGNGNQEQANDDDKRVVTSMPDSDLLKNKGVFDFLAKQGNPFDDDFVQHKSNGNKDEQQIAVSSGEDDIVINDTVSQDEHEDDKDISPTDETMMEEVELLENESDAGAESGSGSALPLAAPLQEEELSQVRQLIGAFCTTTSSKDDDDTRPQPSMSVCCVGTNTIAEGLIQWTIRLLQIQRSLPFLSNDIGAILKHMYDLYLTTIFRNVCGNSPLNERVLLYNDVSTSSFTAVTGGGGVTPHHSGRSSPLTTMTPHHHPTGSRRSSSTLLMSNNNGHGHGRSASQSALVMVSSTIEAELCYPPPNRVPRYVVLRKYLKHARERAGNPGPSPIAYATHSRKNSFVTVQQEQPLLASQAPLLVPSRDDVCRTFEQEFSATKSLLLAAVVLELAIKSLTGDTDKEEASTAKSSYLASHQDLVEYCAQIQQVVPLMMPLLERMASVRAIGGGFVVQDIVAVSHTNGWGDEAMSLMANGSNPYVEELLERCASVWIHMHRHSNSTVSCNKLLLLPETLRHQAWSNVVGASYLAMMEGFSKVPQCSTEGRALMSMDLAFFAEGVSKYGFERFLPDQEEKEGVSVVPLPPGGVSHSLERGMAWVDTYVKQFYFDELSVKQWVEANWGKYRLGHVLSLIKSGGITTEGSASRKRKIVAELIEHSKLLYLHKQLNAASQ